MASDHHHHHAHGDHGHGHAHDHAHSHTPANFDRAFAIGVALNLGFVIVEAAFGFASNSLALLADAGHNLSDVAGLLLAWGAAWLARKQPTSRRTYGYGRTTILAALFNAALLLAAIGALSLEAVRRLMAPQPIEAGVVMAVAGAGIVVNGVTALMFMRGRKDDLNIRGAFLHMLSDAVVSAGVVLAALVFIWTGWLWLDPVVSLVVVAVVAIGTWGLLKGSLAMAVDAVPPGIDRDAVFGVLCAAPGVSEVHDLHIWPLSTTSTALTAHLVRQSDHIDDDLTAALCSELKRRFGIAHVTLQFETGRLACDLQPDGVV